MFPRPCTQCGEIKDVTGFGKAGGYADGHKRICKVCSVQNKTCWRRNGGTVKENATDAARARKTKYRKSPKGKATRQTPEYKAAAVERTKRWVKANPEQFKFNRQKRMLRKGRGKVYAAQLNMLRDQFGGACAYCGGSATTFDHVEPLARGGKHHVDNLVPACKPCNFSKNDKPLLVWMIDKIRSSSVSPSSTAVFWQREEV